MFGLGRSIIKNTLGSMSSDIPSYMFGGLGRAATFGVGIALANEIINGSNRRAAPAGNYMPTQNQAVKSGESVNYYANVALARIALCYYMAKADGNISPEEQMDLDYMCSSLLNNPNASASFRGELQKISSDRSMNFLNVEPYLDKLDLNTLNQLQQDMMRIAELTDGVTANERKALTIFQNYIAGKCGFPGSNMNEQFAGKARVINLKCTGCGADLTINDARTETYCPYCGSKQIIMH